MTDIPPLLQRWQTVENNMPENNMPVRDSMGCVGLLDLHGETMAQTDERESHFFNCHIRYS